MTCWLWKNSYGDPIMVTNCSESELAAGIQLETYTQHALEYAENILETVREPLVVLDSDLKILSANASFYKTFNVAPDETIGNYIFDLGNRQWDIPALRILLNDILPQNTVFNDYEVEHVFQSIGSKIILLNARQIFRKDIGSHIILLAMEDITEKKRLTEQLIHSQKLETIGELAGGLAHDMNNLLSVINGYATLAAQGVNEDKKLLGYINQIMTASTRAASLSQSLLAYSRKQTMDPHNHSLKTLLENVASFIKRILRENVVFTLALADEPLMVNVDAMQMDQVLLNLATNARDVMPGGGTLTIATHSVTIDNHFIANHGLGEVGHYAVINVIDTGHGMDAKTRSKVFDPFFTTKETGKGTGLGLSIVMGIISQHGGFIELESQPDEGSTFSLYLPLVEKGEVAAKAAESSLTIKKCSGTVLIAEDDPDTRIAMEKFLTHAGYKVIAAVDGQDAVEKFVACKEKIQIVILDMVMPRKSGRTACEEIRVISPETRFLLASGHTEKVIMREGNLPADVELIMKPLRPLELMAKIGEIINR